MKPLTRPGLFLLFVMVAGISCTPARQPAIRAESVEELIEKGLEEPVEEAPEEAVEEAPEDDLIVNVNVGPQPVRITEPEYTRAARRKKIRAELVLNVLVDEQGRVAEAAIIESYLLGDDPEDKQPVTEVGYGLEEEALKAALHWRFRPAYRNGQPVSSYQTITFKFGV